MTTLCTFSKLFVHYECRDTYCFAILDIIRITHLSTIENVTHSRGISASEQLLNLLRFVEISQTSCPRLDAEFFQRICYCRRLHAHGRENVNDLSTCLPIYYFPLLFIQIITQLWGFRFICFTVSLAINLNSYAVSFYLLER